MGGSPFREVIQNTREEALSSDLVRQQALSSKALQDELMFQQSDTNNVPINCFTKVPSLVGNAGVFTAALGDGEALFNDATGVTADDSSFKVIQWVAQNLLFTNPDGANPRIDLIVATPAPVSTDNSVRNILLDAVTRAFAPANVPKTLDPHVVPVVVAGVAGATPVPPAVPAGAIALFEVYVPAAAADAVAFHYVQRIFRKSAYPMTGGLLEASQNGIIRGCKITYDVGGAEGILSGVPNENQVVIDGEVLSFGALFNFGSVDTANPLVAAPAGNDKPFYIYVCGGRGLPQNNGLNPCILISSLTPPNLQTGRPTAALGTPRGATQSAVYVGIGFIRKNTTNHQVCRAAEGRVYCASNVALDLSFEPKSGIAGGAVDITLASAPVVSDQAVVVFSHTVAAALAQALLTAKSSLVTLWGDDRLAGAGVFNAGQATLPIPAGAGPHLTASVTGAGSSLALAVIGYNTNVRRLG